MSQTVLITGTSSGIGRATALAFHARGWNVAATMRDPRAEQELTALDNVLVTRLDVTDQASIDDAVASTAARFGGIDVLVNNAGYGAYGPLEAFSAGRIRQQFDTNVIGLLATTQAVLPHLRANGSGCVVNISSIGGRLTFPLGSLYHGTKFAVEGISESLHFELAPLGIKVKIVEPGAVATEFTGRSLDFANDESLTDYQPIVRKVVAGFEKVLTAAAQPALVADVVITAATDGTDQLRYPAGDDAKAALDSRATTDDTVIAAVKAQFAL
ncbi:MAG TPA: SDR family oxidoreductase [Umezawaea sp.]|nr:SDR family oxidoreductase [Umezawaea sp.]